jgi:acyl carrier protein
LREAGLSSIAAVREAVGRCAKAAVPADDEASLFDSGVIDSFALMELVSSLEESLGVRVPDSDLTPRKFESIARIAAYFDSHK